MSRRHWLKEFSSTHFVNIDDILDYARKFRTSEKNVKARKIALTSLLAVAVGFGVTSCTANEKPSGPVVEKTQAGAKKTVDEFLNQVSTDLAEYEASLVSKNSSEEKVNSFNESFKESSGYVKSGAFSAEDSQSLISSFAQIYVYDREARIESEESDYALSGDTAVIKGADFSVTIDGEEQRSAASADDVEGKMTLTHDGSRWLISGFESGR